MPTTDVMLVGALPAQAGFPGAGGPNQHVDYPYQQLPWRMNRHAPIPSTWEEPQNLLRVTNKTARNKMSSAGRPITSALAGVASPILAGLAAVENAENAVQNGDRAAMTNGRTGFGFELDVGTLKAGWIFSATSAAILGGTMAAIHGYRRNRSNTGSAVVWGLFGAVFPLVTNGVALAQGYAKPR